MIACIPYKDWQVNWFLSGELTIAVVIKSIFLEIDSVMISICVEVNSIKVWVKSAISGFSYMICANW
jgi:hypothetical protein